MSGKHPRVSKSAGSTKRRRVIDLEQKINIIRRYEGGQSLTSIAREVGMPISTVSTIVKDSARIKEHVESSAPLKSTVITKRRSGIIYEMEKLLTIWMEDQIQQCVPLSLMAIQHKARSLFEDLKAKKGDTETSFVASHGWFNRFKARANFQNMRMNGEATGADNVASEYFPDVLAKVIKEGGYLPEQVFNVDEAGLFWKRMPDRTYISKEEKTTPGCKAGKDRLTLLLGGNAAGDCKLKPLLVYHSERPRAFKGISKATLPMTFRSNPKAWVTLALFEDWFVNCFIPEVEKYCLEKRIPFKILLVLDNAPDHPAHLDDFHPNIKVVYLPPNKTSLLQPMDQGVTFIFKAYYLQMTFAQARAVTEGEPGKTLQDFWKGYNIYQAIRNIATAWEDISKGCMNSVWKKLCPQFVHGFRGFDKDAAFKEVANKIVKLAQGLELEVDVVDIEGLIQSHAEELSSEDLMELEAQRLAEEAKEEDHEPVEEPKSFTPQEMSVAFREINTAMGRFESMDPNASRFMKVNRLIQDALACYREIYEEKKKATIQPSLDKFMRKFEWPACAPSTSSAPCTSSEPPATLAPDIKTEADLEDVKLVSVPSPSSAPH
ncbi:tigger transposable element-derived protein 1-like [Lepisosteus oculatus]|uniref:tigger transposable element-derived protein 1-like n=1 Tax=Lepisosteus oculatus TaxID=7918 RepID=UPI0037160E93